MHAAKWNATSPPPCPTDAPFDDSHRPTHGHLTATAPAVSHHGMRIISSFSHRAVITTRNAGFFADGVKLCIQTLDSDPEHGYQPTMQTENALARPRACSPTLSVACARALPCALARPRALSLTRVPSRPRASSQIQIEVCIWRWCICATSSNGQRPRHTPMLSQTSSLVCT